MPENKPPLWKIALASTPEQIGQCSAVMRELRPHIEAIDFAARVLQQQKEGYQLAYLELDRVVRCVAGFRIFNMLFSGRTLYIDDLVTHDSDRSRGFGAALFDWLVQHAKENGCIVFISIGAWISLPITLTLSSVDNRPRIPRHRGAVHLTNSA